LPDQWGLVFTSHCAWKGIGMRVCLLLAAILGSLVSAPQVVKAQTLTTLYSFQGSPDGANPLAGVVLDSEGNLILQFRELPNSVKRKILLGLSISYSLKLRSNPSEHLICRIYSKNAGSRSNRNTL
jgi:hypothetical protein